MIPASILVVLIGLCAGLFAIASSPEGGSDPGAIEEEFVQPIDWQKCGDFSCAAVQAPLDWQKDSRATITLALIKHSATGTREGTLVANPGGPGGSGIDLVGGGVDQAVDPTVARHFDLIGFDPRGVGYSTAVKCYDAKKMDGFLYGILPGAIGSPTWLAASRKADTAFESACATRTGALLRHVDTESVARDLDLIRADLGEKKLDYLGYSYGTFLGAVYAGLFPTHVGRFVLDGADDPWFGGSDEDAGLVAQVGGFEGDLRAYVAACVAESKAAVGSTACPLHGTAAAGIKQVSALLDKVAAAPQPSTDGRRLGDATLATAISSALYRTSDWPRLTLALRGVQSGDPAAAFQLADQYNGRTAKGAYPDNMTDAFVAVTCLESPGNLSLADMKKEAAKLTAVAPVLGKYQAYSNLVCARWPKDSEPFPRALAARGAGSILVVGTTGDPATPYSNAVALTKQLTTAHLLTRVGEGHTAYNLGNTCINTGVDAFLTAGTVPTGSAARCH